MKHELNEIWVENYGKSKVYRLQCPNGIMSFKTRKQAEKWQQAYKIVKSGLFE